MKAAAYHYLCELYLAKGIELEKQGESGESMYQQAIQYASNVIGGGVYALMTERFGSRKNEVSSITGGADVYWDLFQVDNVNYQDGNTECIWAYQIDFDAYSEGDAESALNYPRDYMPALRVREGFVGTDADVGGRGVAYVVPTMYMIEDIWKDELSDDIRNAEHNIQRTFRFNDPSYEKYGEVAPDEIIYSDNDAGMSYPIWWKLSTDEFYDVPYGNVNSLLFRDDYTIRLPETLLLRAEAYWRTGSNANAAADINTIRQRAQCSYLVSSGGRLP